MTPLDLLKLTLGLVVAAVVVHPGPGVGEEDFSIALRHALRDLMLNAACATALAAVLLWLLPVVQQSHLATLTLSQLHERQKSTKEWLERAWYLPMAGALVWLAVALATGAAVRGVRAAPLGKSLAWGLRLKVVAGLVGLLGLTAVGTQGRAERLVEACAAQIGKLAEARVLLTNDALQAAWVAMAEPMAAAIADAPVVVAVAPAYWTARPSLRLPEWPGYRRRFDAALVAEVDGRAGDMSTDRALALHTMLRTSNANVPDDARKLVAVVIEAAFDEGAAEPLRDALLKIDNPLFNELLGAALDPVLARPLREALVRLAVGAMQGNTPEEMRSAATVWWTARSTQVRERWLQAVTRAGSAWAERSTAPLGQPRWQAARARLAVILPGAEATTTPWQGSSFLFKPGEMERDLVDSSQLFQADEAARRMARLWASLDPLLVHQAQRRDLAERTAAVAMLEAMRDADRGARSMASYLELWGSALAETTSAAEPSGDANPVPSADGKTLAALLRYFDSQGPTLAAGARRLVADIGSGSLGVPESRKPLPVEPPRPVKVLRSVHR